MLFRMICKGHSSDTTLIAKDYEGFFSDAEGNKKKVAQFIHIHLAGSKFLSLPLMSPGEDRFIA